MPNWNFTFLNFVLEYQIIIFSEIKIGDYTISELRNILDQEKKENKKLKAQLQTAQKKKEELEAQILIDKINQMQYGNNELRKKLNAANKFLENHSKIL